jgi:hypothetical protein
VTTPTGRYDVRRVGVVAVVAVALVLAGSWLLRPAADAAPDVDEATELASRHVEALVSLSSSDAAAGLERLEAQATGEWAAQLAADPTAVARALEAGGVRATGHVDSTAVVAGAPGEPRVLVAASALVSNRAGAERTTRTYYFVVTTGLVDGAWKVAGVEAAR